LLLQVTGNQEIWIQGGLSWHIIQNFMKINQLVQKLKGKATHIWQDYFSSLREEHRLNMLHTVRPITASDENITLDVVIFAVSQEL
jgi:hypothetical protein